ncbi:MAG: prolyl oligopeptidase family serine peptidase, partial [Myxococcota bacterium]
MGFEMHPSAYTVLFWRNQPDDRKRPFRKISLFELDLHTMKVSQVLKSLHGFRKATYVKAGTALLLQGAPTLFGTKGRDPKLPAKALSNGYEGEAYLYDRAKGTVTAITRTFDPSVEDVFWHAPTQRICLQALVRTRKAVYCTAATPTPQWQKINRTASVDIVSRAQTALKSKQMAWLGGGLQHPNRLYVHDLKRQRERMIYDPNAERQKQVRLGTVQDWSVKFSNDTTLDGRVYLPPGFSKQKRYPLLVYYYGGTYPVTRNFDGRYPFHLWAAHGYVIYVLQPSGAPGYGQTFASRHVNEWGTRVPNEIINATRSFLTAHSYVDPKRIGCLGASYGGYTTMKLLTQTNMFRAAISHAGISNIPSYWGGGYWGYLYSSTSAAKRYPWSHPKYFTQQSPLFSAHKITTPLLLLHGKKDTNVPFLESAQMFAALRLLGKPVELFEVKDTDHWVIDTKRLKLWSRNFLAWFDKQLKQQPQWWEALHGQTKTETSKHRSKP